MHTICLDPHCTEQEMCCRNMLGSMNNRLLAVQVSGKEYRGPEVSAKASIAIQVGCLTSSCQQPLRRLYRLVPKRTHEVEAAKAAVLWPRYKGVCVQTTQRARGTPYAYTGEHLLRVVCPPIQLLSIHSTKGALILVHEWLRLQKHTHCHPTVTHKPNRQGSGTTGACTTCTRAHGWLAVQAHSRLPGSD